jgi:hypothetical protein
MDAVGDEEILISIRWGTHQPDLRLVKSIPSVGEVIYYNYFDQDDDDYVVEQVRHLARDLEADYDDSSVGSRRTDRPTVEIVVTRHALGSASG